MPGAPAPFVDPWAPAVFVFGTGGAGGPLRSTEGAGMNSASQSYDTTLNIKIAGTIVLALITVFALQLLGFRFVVTAGVGS